ncbi:Acetoacetate metabolism regulatory protein AtoC [Nitrospira japonica]|uniref:Acetoacetate metabolism regulatory protein AtoC n=1 Tax=Nitrospira japonica TaxID=1325564 RepID=A0A1W1I2U0_9BACT|nr:sigma-54 dependent transcriptional regulator [Nitrospira japonica]SLM47314.1 Acetoacetate metabolism regulatory protein AtoC [Nitrospira japonica]
MDVHSHVLVVDDDEDTRGLLSEILAKEGYDVETASDGKTALERITDRPPDLVMSDIHMPSLDGMSLLEELRSRNQDVPVILMTAFGSLKTAVDGLRSGAFDYLSKPFIVDDIRLVVRRALEHKHLSRQNQALKEQLRDRYRFDNLVGSSAGIVSVYKSIARVAHTDSTVLLQGESGTGKELIARAVHANSARSAGPFVAVDGGSLAETLLESELFGHERGSFTGAVASKKGLLEKAHQGTCFLDEVADLSPVLQGKLLRVIQEREIRRVGSNAPMNIDVRIIAASKKDLDQLVKAGTFREDLYYRLNVVTIQIPPLRERAEDIPLLTQYFIQMYGQKKSPPVTGIAPEAMSLLTRYWWPGNIRELEHAIERAIALTPQSVIFPEDLPQSIQTATVQAAAQARGWVTLAELEKDHILRVLEAHNQDLGRAAAILGIHRKTLLRKLRYFGYPC